MCFEFLCCFTNHHMEYIFCFYEKEKKSCSVDCYKQTSNQGLVCMVFLSNNLTSFTYKPVVLPSISCFPALQQKTRIFKKLFIFFSIGRTNPCCNKMCSLSHTPLVRSISVIFSSEEISHQSENFPPSSVFKC